MSFIISGDDVRLKSIDYEITSKHDKDLLDVMYITFAKCLKDFDQDFVVLKGESKNVRYKKEKHYEGFFNKFILKKIK